MATETRLRPEHAPVRQLNPDEAAAAMALARQWDEEHRRAADRTGWVRAYGAVHEYRPAEPEPASWWEWLREETRDAVRTLVGPAIWTGLGMGLVLVAWNTDPAYALLVTGVLAVIWACCLGFGKWVARRWGR